MEKIHKKLNTSLTSKITHYKKLSVLILYVVIILIAICHKQQRKAKRMDPNKIQWALKYGNEAQRKQLEELFSQINSVVDEIPVSILDSFSDFNL